MAKREKVKAGNNTIEADDEFVDGYDNGDLYYYDTNHQLPRPLTGESIRAFMVENLFDQRETDGWNAGFVLGWIKALFENNPAYFYTSILITEFALTEPLPTISMQEA